MVAGELAHGVGRGRVPGQGGRPGRQVVRPRQVKKGRQKVARGGLAGRDELRDAEGADPFRVAGVDEGEGAIRSAEVDADQVARSGHDAVIVWLDAYRLLRRRVVLLRIGLANITWEDDQRARTI